MAKSLRSNTKRRWRALKRRNVEVKKDHADLEELQYKLQCTIQGVDYKKKEAPNAFLNPKDSTAVFPQWKPQSTMDFRCHMLPDCGTEYHGARRKKKINPRSTYVEEYKEITIDMDGGSADFQDFQELPEQQDDEDSEMEGLAEQMEGQAISVKEKNEKKKRDMVNEPIQPTKKINKNTKVRAKRSKKLIRF